MLLAKGISSITIVQTDITIKHCHCHYFRHYTWNHLAKNLTHHFTQFDNASATILITSNCLCDGGAGLFLQFLLNL